MKKARLAKSSATPVASIVKTASLRLSGRLRSRRSILGFPPDSRGQLLQLGADSQAHGLSLAHIDFEADLFPLEDEVDHPAAPRKCVRFPHRQHRSQPVLEAGETPVFSRAHKQ